MNVPRNAKPPRRPASSARGRLAGPGAVADDADTALAQCAVELGDAQGAAGMFLQVLQRTGERHIEVRRSILGGRRWVGRTRMVVQLTLQQERYFGVPGVLT